MQYACGFLLFDLVLKVLSFLHFEHLLFTLRIQSLCSDPCKEQDVIPCLFFTPFSNLFNRQTEVKKDSDPTDEMFHMTQQGIEP